MRIVYLDQNKWIELGRIACGRSHSEELQGVLDFARGARDMRLACFPLSTGHYMETQKQRNPQKRLDLATFMRELSGGKTMLNPTAILEYEIEQALFRRFPGRVRAERIQRLELLGDGISHALGLGQFTLELSRAAVERATPAVRSKLECAAYTLIEEALLSFINPITRHPFRPPDLSAPDKAFKEHLDIWPDAIRGKDCVTAETMLYAGTLRDIWESVSQILARHGISLDDFAALGEQGWREFLNALPTRRVDMHLHRQWAKNRSLPTKSSDLNDWIYLGSAVMHCDVVVTERQFADLIKRDGFQCRAEVLTDLPALPRVLLSKN